MNYLFQQHEAWLRAWLGSPAGCHTGCEPLGSLQWGWGCLSLLPGRAPLGGQHCLWHCLPAGTLPASTPLYLRVDADGADGGDFKVVTLEKKEKGSWRAGRLPVR